MIRAMETAMHNFPGWTLRPLPYIAETGMTPDNIPLTWEEQERKLDLPPNSPEDHDAIEYDVASKTHPDRRSFKKSSYDEFRNFLPLALEELLPTLVAGAEIPIVIV